MLRTRGIKNSWQRFSDFNLLLFLADMIDPATAHIIAECVAEEKPIGEHILEIIEQISDI